jgi:hypothetical protein
MHATPQDLVRLYGLPGTNPQYYTTLIIDYKTASVVNCPTRIYCNKSLAKPLMCVIHRMAESKLYFRSWDGCYNIRARRGVKRKAGDAILTRNYSLHSWGVAVDINARSPLRPRDNEEDFRIIQIMEAYGFIWGGNFSKPDYMHFELNLDYLI